MENKAVPDLGRSKRKKKFVVNKNTLIYVIFQISILSIILLFPVFYQSLLAYKSTLLALCTLVLFAGIIVYLSIRLLILVIDCMGSGKHAKPLEDDVPLNKRTSLQRMIEFLTISLWTFIFKLFHPFVAALVWWQGYKLMEGNVFSLGEIEGTAMMIEALVYFVFIILLLLLSRPCWSYGLLNRSKSVLSYEENVIITKGKTMLRLRKNRKAY